MKKSITLAAILVALSASVFAAGSSKSGAANTNSAISFTSSSDDKGFAVTVDAEKTVVMIYDQDNNVIFKDLVSKGLPTEKSYNVTGLDNGDYTVEVKTENGDVKKQMHVYDDGQSKSYFFVQE